MPLSSIRESYRRALREFLRRSFPVWQRVGLHVIPNHFYYPVPDTRKLRSSLWTDVDKLPGIVLNENRQLELLTEFASRYRGEYEQFPREKSGTDPLFLNNGLFEGVDAEVLYSMIRYFRPRRVFEIGSGFSTFVTTRAARKNEMEGAPCDVHAFEPYPRIELRTGLPGLTELHACEVQDVPLSTFAALEANDILFIDSSHVLTIGSDVQYEFLQILPTLAPGVVVHVHDIFLPADYPREWVLKRNRFWNEQYVLQAFLTFNSEWEIIWAGHYMHMNHPERLKSAFRSYGPSTRPVSFWIRRSTQQERPST
jgi:hypothetical protein